MQVILIKDISKLGRRGEQIKVKDGYARNFLIPKGYALEASEGNMANYKEMEKQLAAKDKKLLAQAEALAKTLSNVSLEIKMEADEKDHLYGSVTPHLIHEKIVAKGITGITASMIKLTESIRKIGTYKIPIELRKDVVAQIKVWVVKN
ncbi:MAG: 50S ribosomal protein L9 [Candidatus Coatesbacteria bacterium]|nr:50S ribosomal protein L9 [Candidatus Coatesbacteria bacterium]